MKKTVGIIYTAVFIAACCVPLAATLISPSSGTTGKEDEAKAPQLFSDGRLNDSIGTQFNDFFTKSIPFRSQVITAQNTLSGAFLGKENNNVITGKNGWLYTKESTDEFIGVRKSSRALHNASETIRIMQECVTAKGMNFVFTVAPDKNQIYPEYMPAGYIKSDTNNLTVLEKYLRADKVNYVSLKDELLGLRKKNKSLLYLKGDTHWNGLGALYGYNAIMNGLGGEHESFSGTDYVYSNDWYGDIAKMAYPAAPPVCRQYYFDIDYSRIRFMQPRTSQSNDKLMEDLMSDKEENDTNIRTINPAGKDSLYISRDSFGRAMLPFLVSNYKSTYITRTRSFDLRAADKNKYTDVVYEIVERKLDSITDTAPLLYAPEVKNVSGTRLSDGGKNKVAVRNIDGALKVYGILDKSKVSDDSRIYVSVRIDGKERTYEAFPITEKELLKTEEKSEYGFTALIEGLGDRSSEAEVAVIVK